MFTTRFVTARRPLARGLSRLAAIAAVSSLAVAGQMALDAPDALAAPDLPDGFGDCIGPDCPTPFPGVDNDVANPDGFDEAINVFVGGDFSAIEAAAEAEGRVVVMGDATIAEATEIYNVGVVGVGSQVHPPEDLVTFAVGSNITVEDGATLALDGDGTPRDYEYAGTESGTITGDGTQNSEAVAAYSDTVAALQDVSTCSAQTEATGDVTQAASLTTFTGDGTSDIQIFNLDTDITGGIAFAGIPDGATVIVNVLGDTRTIDTFSGGDGSSVDALRENLLWNFTDATEVNLTGSAQFQGSTLVANPDSTTTISYPGMNGRVYANGDLVHAGQGTEMHAYPFRGDLPDCIEEEPAIELTKTADPAEYDTVGQTVTYTFIAENTGNVDLSDVTITETDFTGAGTMSTLDCLPPQPAMLAPGDTIACTATYEIQQADLDAGQVDNAAQAVGTGPNEEQVTDEDDQTVSGVQQEEEDETDEEAEETEEETQRQTTKDETETLAETGAGSTGLAGLAALLISIGGALLVARRRALSRLS